MLIRSVEKFLRRHAMAPTTFSRLATRDPRFVADLRNGRQPGPALERRVEHFMNTYPETSHAR